LTLVHSSPTIIGRGSKNIFHSSLAGVIDVGFLFWECTLNLSRLQYYIPEIFVQRVQPVNRGSICGVRARKKAKEEK
jgi:hypothetical protein